MGYSLGTISNTFQSVYPFFSKLLKSNGLQKNDCSNEDLLSWMVCMPKVYKDFCSISSNQDVYEYILLVHWVIRERNVITYNARTPSNYPKVHSQENGILSLTLAEQRLNAFTDSEAKHSAQLWETPCFLWNLILL